MLRHATFPSTARTNCIPRGYGIKAGKTRPASWQRLKRAATAIATALHIPRMLLCGVLQERPQLHIAAATDGQLGLVLQDGDAVVLFRQLDLREARHIEDVAPVD